MLRRRSKDLLVLVALVGAILGTLALAQDPPPLGDRTVKAVPRNTSRRELLVADGMTTLLKRANPGAACNGAGDPWACCTAALVGPTCLPEILVDGSLSIPGGVRTAGHKTLGGRLTLKEPLDAGGQKLVWHLPNGSTSCNLAADRDVTFTNQCKLPGTEVEGVPIVLNVLDFGATRSFHNSGAADPTDDDTAGIQLAIDSCPNVSATFTTRQLGCAVYIPTGKYRIGTFAHTPEVTGTCAGGSTPGAACNEEADCPGGGAGSGQATPWCAWLSTNGKPVTLVGGGGNATEICVMHGGCGPGGVACQSSPSDQRGRNSAYIMAPGLGMNALRDVRFIKCQNQRQPGLFSDPALAPGTPVGTLQYSGRPYGNGVVILADRGTVSGVSIEAFGGNGIFLDGEMDGGTPPVNANSVHFEHITSSNNGGDGLRIWSHPVWPTETGSGNGSSHGGTMISAQGNWGRGLDLRASKSTFSEFEFNSNHVGGANISGSGNWLSAYFETATLPYCIKFEDVGANHPTGNFVRDNSGCIKADQTRLVDQGVDNEVDSFNWRTRQRFMALNATHDQKMRDDCAAGAYYAWASAAEGKLKKCQNGVVSDWDTFSGTSTTSSTTSTSTSTSSSSSSTSSSVTSTSSSTVATTTSSTSTTVNTCSNAGAGDPGCDNFNRANNADIGSLWTPTDWTGANTALEIIGTNSVRSSSGSATDAIEAWTGLTPTATAQYACMENTSTAGSASAAHKIGGCVAIDNTADDAVCCTLQGDGTVISNVDMFAYDNATFDNATTGDITGLSLALGARVGIERTSATAFRCAYATAGASSWTFGASQTISNIISGGRVGAVGRNQNLRGNQWQGGSGTLPSDPRDCGTQEGSTTTSSSSSTSTSTSSTTSTSVASACTADGDMPFCDDAEARGTSLSSGGFTYTDMSFVGAAGGSCTIGTAGFAGAIVNDSGANDAGCAVNTGGGAGGSVPNANAYVCGNTVGTSVIGTYSCVCLAMTDGATDDGACACGQWNGSSTDQVIFLTYDAGTTPAGEQIRASALTFAAGLRIALQQIDADSFQLYTAAAGDTTWTARGAQVDMANASCTSTAGSPWRCCTGLGAGNCPVAAGGTAGLVFSGNAIGFGSWEFGNGTLPTNPQNCGSAN